ncbi:leucine-rich repeat domain-containing protein [Streptomyces sp. NBC_01465]|uniref:leucine-rich repeat domain-containing protein n=1 Tax=Streptomyces sp. NBC_01465 TaxID=2903878 RepID=UPI002E35FD2D|nr:leucine-rich repeat domain-containing protein [Streptomyces sp. NBC_01465]
MHLLELIDEAVADGREVFKPLVELSPSERRQVVTLPSAIARLTEVKQFVLYGSNVTRVPPEIGMMKSLEEFSPYTSRRLHWFPYEITRCAKLRQSTVSTRALYGNFKYRPPFPLVDHSQELCGEVPIASCSVCDGPVEARRLQRAWISLGVATDVLPLLVNACSAECIGALPTPAEGYVAVPHHGRPGLRQPPPRH